MEILLQKLALYAYIGNNLLVEITPKSLILDLLSTLPPRGGHSMPVRALVEAGEDFGMGSSSVRVALARLLAQERVERDERGRYRLGVAAGAVSGAIRNWRRLEEQLAPWQGGWVAVYRSRGGGRAARRQGAGALVFLGFRELEPGLFLRPDNLRGGVDEMRRRLSDLGLEDASLIFGLSDLDPASETRAWGLWDRGALGKAYREASESLERSRARLCEVSMRDAMVETFRLGGQVIRQLVLDPLLPEEMAPAAPREALAAQMRDYDEFGRGCWAEFLAKHGVSRRRTPADLRVVEGTEQRVSAALLRGMHPSASFNEGVGGR